MPRAGMAMRRWGPYQWGERGALWECLVFTTSIYTILVLTVLLFLLHHNERCRLNCRDRVSVVFLFCHHRPDWCFQPPHYGALQCRLRGGASTPSMAKLATMRHIVGAEQDADITVILQRRAFPGTARPARLSVLRQVPPEFLRHASLEWI